MKRYSSVFLSMLLVGAAFAKAPNPACSGSQNATFPQGDGSKASPYLVCNLAQYDRLGSENGLLTNFFALGADLDFTNHPYHIIGSSSTPFQGGFDGKEYTLSSITIPQDTQEYLAPFGYIDGGEVNNLNVKNITLTYQPLQTHVGGVIGFAQNAKFDNLQATAVDLTAYRRLGGIAGELNHSTLSHASVSGTITLAGGADQTGGLVGNLSYSEVTASKSDLVFQLRDSGEDGAYGVTELGGLIGHCYISDLKNVYSTSEFQFDKSGNTRAPRSAGGLIGSFYQSKIQYAYFAGLMLMQQGDANSNSSSDIGPNIGDVSGNSCIQQVFYDKELSPSFSNAWGNAKSTSELKSKAFWEAEGFSKKIWKLENNQYPTLKKS